MHCTVYQRFFDYFSVSQDIRCGVHTAVQQFFFCCSCMWYDMDMLKRNEEKDRRNGQEAGVRACVCEKTDDHIRKCLWFSILLSIYCIYLLHIYLSLLPQTIYFIWYIFLMKSHVEKLWCLLACFCQSFFFGRIFFFSMGGSLTDILCQFCKLRYYAVMVCGVTWCSPISFGLTHYHRHDLQQHQHDSVNRFHSKKKNKRLKETLPC